MTVGEDIFRKNSRAILRDIGMSHLDWDHGAAVNIVRRCMNIRGRPTHHQQAFLEVESPALLAYLEKLAASGQMTGWRTLEARVRLGAEVLRERELHPCARPWLAAIWHSLPELVALGQAILDRSTEKSSMVPDSAPVASDAATGSGGDGDKGSAGKAGSATSHKPHSLSRLALPIVTVTLTLAEKKALDLGNGTEGSDAEGAITPDGPEGTDGTDGAAGPKAPGGIK